MNNDKTLRARERCLGGVYRLFWILLALLAFVSASSAQTFQTLYSFTGQNGSETPEFVVPAQGRNGALFGTTFGPSDGSSGSIFELTTAGHETDLFTFNGNGATPLSSLTLGADGNFYGTTPIGGASDNGVLFRITPQGTFTILHEFGGGIDGALPQSPPIQASNGDMYGTTEGTGGASTVYRYTSDGVFSTIYMFDQEHGQNVAAGLVQGTDGLLNGTASTGGNSDCGTVFKISTSGIARSAYSFRCGSAGAFPMSTLIQGADGNLYGTTFGGGSNQNLGTVFKVSQSGKVSRLYTFPSRNTGGFPLGLTEGTDGNLYGIGAAGGNHNQGVLFQITKSGAYTLLYSFENQNGSFPAAPPVQHTNGLFYGTTSQGGQFFLGSVYSLDMALGPFIKLVQPTGKVGRTVQILGQGLTGTTSVTFNGIAATSFKVQTDTYMVTVVPSGATTGPVVVTTPSGTLTSNKNFQVKQ